MDTNTDDKKVNKIRELFRGRFAVEEAQRLLEHHNGDLQGTVNFVLTAERRDVQDICRTDNEGFQVVRNNAAWAELARQGDVRNEKRQFACVNCDFVWWRKVPFRKPVSKCYNVCRNRFKAIPQDQEWGWAEFNCTACGDTYRGFGQMGNTWSPCYRCGAPNLPSRIIPPKKNRRRGRGRGGERRRTVDNHSCFSANCFQKAVGPTRPGICVHPRSLNRKVVVPSDPHVSTGSTVDTFLTQDDLDSNISDFEPSLSDVDEGNDG